MLFHPKNKKLRIVLFAVSIFLLGMGVGFELGQRYVGTDTPETAEPNKSVEIMDGDGIDIVWKIEKLGEDENFVPAASVKSEVNGKTYELGKFSGNCFVIERSEWELLENELSGVICWWAGGGEEVGVFKENGKLEIRKGIIDEGGEDVGNYRGNFLKVFQVED